MPRHTRPRRPERITERYDTDYAEVPALARYRFIVVKPMKMICINLAAEADGGRLVIAQDEDWFMDLIGGGNA